MIYVHVQLLQNASQQNDTIYFIQEKHSSAEQWYPHYVITSFHKVDEITHRPCPWSIMYVHQHHCLGQVTGVTQNFTSY